MEQSFTSPSSHGVSHSTWPHGSEIKLHSTKIMLLLPCSVDYFTQVEMRQR